MNAPKTPMARSAEDNPLNPSADDDSTKADRWRISYKVPLATVSFRLLDGFAMAHHFC